MVSHPSGECSTRRQQLKCFICRGKHTANYRGCANWREAKAALTKRTPASRNRTNGSTGRSASAQATRTEPSAEQKTLGTEWSHLVRGGRVLKPTTPSQPEPTLKAVATPKQGKATACRKEVKAAQPAIESPQQAPMKKMAMTGKSSPSPMKKPNPDSIPPPNQSPIEKISDLLDNLPADVCVEVTRLLLTAVHTLFRGSAHAGCPENSCSLCSRLWLHSLGHSAKALLMTCWNADGVRGRTGTGTGSLPRQTRG